MSKLLEALKAKGYELKVNTDGEWKPYTGDYIVSWKTLRKEKAKNGANYWKAEWDILETLKGDQKRNSKYADFGQAYFFDLSGDSEKDAKELEALLGDAFTFGVELDASSDDSLASSASALIGMKGYIHAYGKKPFKKEGAEWVEDTSKAMKQGISVRTLAKGEKLRTSDSVPF